MGSMDKSKDVQASYFNPEFLFFSSQRWLRSLLWADQAYQWSRLQVFIIRLEAKGQEERNEVWRPQVYSCQVWWQRRTCSILELHADNRGWTSCRLHLWDSCCTRTTMVTLKCPATRCWKLILRRTGIGSHLMQLLENIARKILIAEKVVLSCFVKNKRAVDFYKKRGYKLDELSPPSRKLRTGVVIEPDYITMSLRIRTWCVTMSTLPTFDVLEPLRVSARLETLTCLLLLRIMSMWIRHNLRLLERGIMSHESSGSPVFHGGHNHEGMLRITWNSAKYTLQGSRKLDAFINTWRSWGRQEFGRGTVRFK